MATRRPREVKQPSPEVSPDDQALFEREVAGARQLARDGRERVRPTVARRAEVGGRVSDDEESWSPLALAGGDFAAPGVDRRELRKLRRGDYAPDVRLDLHGLKAVEAVTQVTRVLDRPTGRRPRCLCVVHGRGLHSPDNVPVLKARVRACLRAHPAVLAFTDAPKDDGGPGAAYVLLRR